MDDQNQANNQLGNQPKKEQPADVTSSAPVEVEPATDSSAMPPASPVSPSPTSPQPSNQPSPVTPPQPSQVPNAPVAQPEGEKLLEMPPQPGLLEAPKKKNGMFVALIAVALVVVLALIGFFVYQAM